MAGCYNFFSVLIRISGFDILQISDMYWVHCNLLNRSFYGPSTKYSGCEKNIKGCRPGSYQCSQASFEVLL